MHKYTDISSRLVTKALLPVPVYLPSDCLVCYRNIFNHELIEGLVKRYREIVMFTYYYLTDEIFD